MRGRDSRTHEAGAEDSNALDFARNDLRIAHTRIAAEAVLREKHADEIRRKGCSDDFERRVLLNFEAFVERSIYAVANGMERRDGGRILALRLGEHRTLGDAKREAKRVFTDAQRLAAALACVLPRAARLKVLDQANALVEQTVGRHRVKREANLDGLLRAASPEVIISIAALMPTRRGKRCVPPQPGRTPIFVSGSAIFVCDALETMRSSIERISSVPPPMQFPSTRATVGNGKFDTPPKS